MFNCYLCGNDCAEVLAEREDMRFRCYGYDKKVLRCLNCNLVQLYPQWTEEELDKLYARYSKKEDFKGQKHKVKISKYLARYMVREADKILEVGCGHGDNVKYLRKKGFNVFGIDKESGTDYRNYNGMFDVIYAIHLLEHLPDPRHFMRWMKKTLVDGGRFILEIPSQDNPLLKLQSYRRFHWYPYHLFFYSKETISKLFPTSKIILKQEYGIINHLRWLLRGKPGNWNPDIPVLDNIYKFILTSLGYGDTLIIVGEKCLTFHFT